MRTIKYDDGIVIEHTPAAGWIDESGDADSRPPEYLITLPAGSIADLESLLQIAAARCVAAETAGFELDFGAKSRLKFTGRMVGAGTSCGWLEVRLRVDRDKYGDAMPVTHLRSYLEAAVARSPHEAVSRVIQFLRAIEPQAVIGAHDEYSLDPEYRRNLSERVSATSLQWYLEDEAAKCGAAPAEQ